MKKTPVVNFEKVRKQGNEYLGAGVGLGVASIGSAVLIGATCPLCIVAVPALVAGGLWKRHKAKQGLCESSEECGEDGQV